MKNMFKEDKINEQSILFSSIEDNYIFYHSIPIEPIKT